MGHTSFYLFTYNLRTYVQTLIDLIYNYVVWYTCYVSESNVKSTDLDL